MTGEDEVLVDRRGRLGVLTLNRPRAINALTHAMVIAVTEALDGWRGDPDVATVAIIGAGDRGLCAGGDVVELHRAAVSGDYETAAAFWRDEYRMNAAIASYPKPIVAVQDGLVLGGGIGISAHASHRVVTERSRLGFPEVTIGFVPDVGASWLLSRAPAASGIRLALTGESIGAADAIYVGFSDSFLPSGLIPSLLKALEQESPSTAISSFAEDAGSSKLAADANDINAAFASPNVLGILDSLHERGLGVMADGIETKSPLALSVTRESLRRARNLESLEQALVVEFRVSMRATATPDFAEGVRAQLIDKDRTPRWSPVDLASVTRQEVESFFTVPGVGDLTFPVRSLSRGTA